ncbi:MAG: ribosome recycling factor [Sandaracinaceae bacterium]|nr:ribosome recycling factor [Sandaracinaceae bacterium]
MIEEALSELKEAIGKAHEALRRELGRIRTGRASPDMLDVVRVDYYGRPTPVSQMASITVPEPRLLVIKPWDKNQLKAIEMAILQSPLGLSPQNDGTVIRVPIPPLTTERRKELAKMARAAGEECKVAIRKARHHCRDILEELKKEGGVSEDEIERAMKRVEEIVHEGVAKVDEIVASKEKDIMTI